MSIDDYYSYVADLMSQSRFKAEIEVRKREYGNLLDDEAIAYLIVDELGRNQGNKMKISDLYDGINATIEARIVSVGNVETRKNHRILKVIIEDDTGSCQFVLWNDEISEVLKELKEGRKIKIINGYVKENMYGLQIGLGKWGIAIFN